MKDTQQTLMRLNRLLNDLSEEVRKDTEKLDFSNESQFFDLSDDLMANELDLHGKKLRLKRLRK